MSLKQALTRHENQMAFFVAWIVFPVLATLGGFYIGTFAASEHVVDMQVKDMRNGGIGALVGLTIAVIGAIIVTAVYPKVIEREYEAREALNHPDASHDHH